MKKHANQFRDSSEYKASSQAFHCQTIAKDTNEHHCRFRDPDMWQFSSVPRVLFDQVGVKVRGRGSEVCRTPTWVSISVSSQRSLEHARDRDSSIT